MRVNLLGIVMLLVLCNLEVSGQKSVTILDHKGKIRIQRMDILNSASRETNISLTPDGRFLYFVSFRGGQPWSNKYMTWKSDSVWDGDIWYSEKINGKWNKPEVMPYGINTSSGEDEPNVLDDGKVVYYQSWDRMWMYNGGPYYKARRKGSVWGKPQGLGGGITEFFRRYAATDGMAISPDEKIFIVAAGLDYEISEKMDLYMSVRTVDGWSFCKKIPISTSGNERSVFLAGDGKTLYFASDGYKGYGGMDIFKTTLKPDGSFGEVINIGKPFNTSQDDYGFILTEDGDEAYFLRDGDIYYGDLTESDERIKPGINFPPPSVRLSLEGRVKNRDNWESIQAQVVILDSKTRMPVRSIKTDGNGAFSLALNNKDREYLLIVSASGFEKKSRSIVIQQQEEDYAYQANFLLNPVSEDEVVAQQIQPPQPQTPEKSEEPLAVPEEPEEEVTKPNPQPQPEPVISETEPVEEEDPYNFDNVADNHLILLLDVSESMNKQNRLPLLKNSFRRLLGYMREQDHISIIVYSGDVTVSLENVSAIEHEKIYQTIENLKSGGSTLGQSGLLQAYKLAFKYFIRAGNNRIIMATDGEFNIDPLIPIASANSKRQIALSIFTFDDQNQDKLQKLAKNGGGNFSILSQENVEQVLLKEAKAVKKR